MSPVVNFGRSEQPDPQQPIPIGEYKCKIVEVREKTSQKGEEYYSLRLEIIEGDYDGRSVYDSLFFSPKALQRLKLICERLGINIEGDVEITPSLFLYKIVVVAIKQDFYINKSGQTINKNIVAYDGYKGLIETTPQNYMDYISSDDVPF